MITRSNRFHGYGSLNYLFRNGKTIRSFFLVIRVVPNPKRTDFRAAVIVAKKVASNSPERNRIRRRIYEVIRLQSPNIIPGSDFSIIVYDSQAATMPAPELTKLVVNLLGRADLLKKPQTKF